MSTSKVLSSVKTLRQRQNEYDEAPTSLVFAGYRFFGHLPRQRWILQHLILICVTLPEPLQERQRPP